MEKEIILGSGNVFITEFTGAIPDDATFETENNKLGAISGGASIEYKPEYYTATDDLGTVSETIITKEEALMKTGVCTLNGNTINKLCSTGRVTEANGKRRLKIGGIGNNNFKKYAVRFVHISGKSRVTIVGQNQSGFVLTYAKDKETVVDAEFKALPHDAEGTLIILDETITETLKALSVSSVAGATSGKTKISVSPALTYPRNYVYKTGSSVVAPTLDAKLNDWQVWDGVSDITATTGNKIGIAEIDGSLNCKAYGEATITSKA